MNKIVWFINKVKTVLVKKKLQTVYQQLCGKRFLIYGSKRKQAKDLVISKVEITTFDDLISIGVLR